jgi:hypothetical protein
MQAMDREIIPPLPALNSSYVAYQIGGDLLPGL